MRMFKRLAVAGAVTGVLLGSAAGVASASTATARPACSTVRLTGGDTSLTTAPGIAAALLSHGIVPLATLPATEGASTSSGGVAVKFAFPVTGGAIDSSIEPKLRTQNLASRIEGLVRTHFLSRETLQ